MKELQALAEAVYGGGVRVHASRGNVYVTSFALGEVMVIRHQDPEASKRMAAAALRAQLAG